MWIDIQILWQNADNGFTIFGFEGIGPFSGEISIGDDINKKRVAKSFVGCQIAKRFRFVVFWIGKLDLFFGW